MNNSSLRPRGIDRWARSARILMNEEVRGGTGRLHVDSRVFGHQTACGQRFLGMQYLLSKLRCDLCVAFQRTDHFAVQLASGRPIFDWMRNGENCARSQLFSTLWVFEHHGDVVLRGKVLQQVIS